MLTHSQRALTARACTLHHLPSQAVTATAWSRYVLKYTAKLQMPTTINMDPNALHQLGLHGISEQQAQLAAAVVLSRAVCPCEAAHLLSGGSILTHSVPVTYIDTRPPSVRTVKVGGGRSGGGGTGFSSGISIGALTTYCNRPHTPECEPLTLPEYFKMYEVMPAPPHLLSFALLQRAPPRCSACHRCPSASSLGRIAQEANTRR